MEKGSVEKDMEEWELLPSNITFFDLDSEKDLFSKELRCDPLEIMDFDYFHCPSENFSSAIEKKQISCHSPIADKYADVDAAQPSIFTNRDAVSDIKMSSPNSNTAEDLIPPIEENEKAYKDQDFLKSMEFIQEERFLKNSELQEKEATLVAEKKGKPLWAGFGLQILGWRLNGIGALCSVGVTAAATICILILGSQQRQQHQYQRLQFQIHADGERINQVMQQASRLNRTLSSMRSIPTRAQISFGGYYDGV